VAQYYVNDVDALNRNLRLKYGADLGSTRSNGARAREPGVGVSGERGGRCEREEGDWSEETGGGEVNQRFTNSESAESIRRAAQIVGYSRQQRRIVSDLFKTSSASPSSRTLAHELSPSSPSAASDSSYRWRRQGYALPPTIAPTP
jgi:hypothetical protein